MENPIAKYLANKKIKIGSLDAVEVLGEEKLVEKAAANWQTNGHYLKTIEIALLLDYVQSQSYTKEELEAYKLGLGAINFFLEDCLLQLEQRYKENK